MEIKVNLILPWPSADPDRETVNNKSWIASTVITRDSIPPIGSSVAIDSILPKWAEICAAGPFIVEDCRFDFGSTPAGVGAVPDTEAIITLRGVLIRKRSAIISVEETGFVRDILIHNGWKASVLDDEADWKSVLENLRLFGWKARSVAEGASFHLDDGDSDAAVNFR